MLTISKTYYILNKKIRFILLGIYTLINNLLNLKINIF